MNSFRALTFRMKVITTFALGVMGAAALGGGILAGSVQEALSQTTPAVEATKLLVAPSADSVNTSVTLRVEVVRDGETLCRGEGKPAMNFSGYENEYYLNKPIAHCPQLQDGDAVQATWIQSTKVNISSAK